MKEKEANRIIQRELKATMRDAKVAAETLARDVVEFVNEKAKNTTGLDVVRLQRIVREIRNLSESLKQ